MFSRTSLADRSTDEVIILCISGAISLCLLPFIYIRLAQGEWAVASLNTFAVLFTSAFFIHVYATRKTHFARWGISLLSVVVMTTTIYLKGASQIVWVYPALTIIFYLLSSYLAVTLCLVFMATVTIMIWPEVTSMFLMKFIVSAMATFLFCLAFSARMRTQAVFLNTLATTDGLTGAGNRRALEERLMEICARLNRYPEQNCSIILFDIDFFKRINDQHGHGIGDTVLREFVKVINKRIRVSDALFRYGGEEFVVVLENTAVLEAMKLAIDLSKDVELHNWPHANLKVTASAGVAQFVGDESSYSWLSRADAALYKAKTNGRNCCLTHDSDVLELVRQVRSTAA